MRTLAILALGFPSLADVTPRSAEPPRSVMVPDESGAMLVHDPSKDRWERIEGGDRPCSRAVAICGERGMLVWGGGDDRRKELLYFDLRTRSWKRMDKPPLEAREAYAAAAHGERLAVWGGTFHWQTYFADGGLYDFRTNRWETLPPAPIEPRAWPGMVFSGSRLVIGGGYGKQAAGYSDGAVFDLSTRSWTRIEAFMPARRSCPTMLAIQDRVFLWGGSREAAWLLDPGTGTREELPASPIGTGGASGSAVLGSRIYLFGGYGEGGGHQKDALEFDLRSRRWRKLPEPPLSERYHPTVLQGRGKVYVFGGLGKSDAFAKDTAVFDPVTNRWTPLAEIPGSSPVVRLYYR